MAKAKTNPSRQPASYRLGPETLQRIRDLAGALTDHLGRPLSQADVIRLAILRLHETHYPPKKILQKN